MSLPAGSDSFHLLTVPQAAERLSVSVATVRRLIRSGQLPSVTLGRCRRIPSTVLQEYAESRLTQMSEAHPTMRS